MSREPNESFSTQRAPWRAQVPRSARDPWRTLGRDLVIGLAVVAGMWLTVLPGTGPERAVQVGLGAIAVAGLLLRDRHPAVAAALTAAATGAAWVLGLTADPFLLTGCCVFVIAERRGSRRFPRWLLAAAGAALLAMIGVSAEGVEDRIRGTVLGASVLATSWALGVRTRQAREEAAARSRQEERLRLVRDVHDVISHSLGTIGVRAGVAAHVTSLTEAELRDLLRDIEQGVRASLFELRDLLDRERNDAADRDAGTVGQEANQAGPGPSLEATLADLALTAERSGLSTRLDIGGDLAGLTATTSTTVHRVVQEAVTNAIRHASATSLQIRVQGQPDQVAVEVRDDGRGLGPAIGEGHGLTGMRERVELAGGSLEVESAAGGVAVIARLPRTLAHENGGGP